jgi:hypothetical protein
MLTILEMNPDSLSNQSAPVVRAMLAGSVGFSFVSLAGYSVWAFSGNWLHEHTGEAGLYIACLLVFLGSSGLFLRPLVHDGRPLLRTYGIFIPAFFAYAILWCAAWFALGFGAGEWAASLAGGTAFVAVTARGFRSFRGFVKVVIVLFIFHSAGYFLGGRLMLWMMKPAAAATLGGLSKAQIGVIAKLGWGLLYGLGFGAGIGYAFYTFQRQVNSSLEPKERIQKG